MELKKEILKLLKEDMGFRNEVAFLLNIDDLEKRVDDLEEKS